MVAKKKRCTICKIMKPLDKFNKRTASPDGLDYQCRICSRAKNREYRALNRDRHVEECRLYRQENKASCLKSKKEYINRNRKARQSQRALGRAVRVGHMGRGACELCGTSDDVEGHHEDYEKALDVTWLCRSHHAARHIEMREGGDS